MPGKPNIHILLACATLACMAGGLAQQAPAGIAAPLAQESLENLLPMISNPETRTQARNRIKQIQPFPGAELVALLGNDRLSVRLGALEILEEQAGRDFDYDPWTSVTDPANQLSIRNWQQWLESPDTKDKPDNLLTDEQRHAYLKELLSDDFNDSARARRMLEIDGLESVAFLENFLTRTPGLDAASRTRIRAAQYQITLAKSFGPQAAGMARQLAFGSRDQLLATLGQLKSGGLLSLPIIQDFLEHADPLVRESAIDAMLASGGAKALPIVKPILLKEADPNVIHGALRRIKEFKGKESIEIASAFLDAKDEDLLISTIQACQQLLKESDRMMGFPMGQEKPSDNDPAIARQGILKTLDHESWRVRAAGLECVADTGMQEAGEICIRLLDDPDPFVCYQAMNAVRKLRLTKAGDVLRKIFMEKPERAGQAIQGYAALGKNIDHEMLARLDQYDPDARIAAIQASAGERKLTAIQIHYCNDRNPDVACAALREIIRDDDNLKRSDVLSLLIDAIQSGSPEKTNVILDNLNLPESRRKLDPRLATQADALINTTDNTSLDPLYNALLGAANATESIGRSNTPAHPNAQNELVEQLTRIASSKDHPGAFKAAIVLARAKYPQGYRQLIADLPSYSTAQRATIASRIDEPNCKEALDLLQLLIHDPIDEVRSNAVSAMISAENNAAIIMTAMNSLTKKGSQLHPADYYSYRLESVCRRNNAASRALNAWATSQLENNEASDQIRILALIILKKRCPVEQQETIARLAKGSPSFWIRRTAWFTLSRINPGEFQQQSHTLANDPSPHVRAVLPAMTSRIDYIWLHHFDDLRQAVDDSSDSDASGRRITPGQVEELTHLATTDTSEEVRYLSMLSLLSHGKPIDTDAFATLLRKRGKEEMADRRIAFWMKQNLGRLGPGMSPIVSALNTEHIDPATMEAIINRVSPNHESRDLTNFASLVQQGGDGLAILQPDTGTDPDKPVQRQSLKLVFFYKPGCEECEKTRSIIDDMTADFPLLTIDSLNINETRNTLLNQALCSRFGVPSTDQNIAPAIFTQSGYLIRHDISAKSLASLLNATKRIDEDNSWADFEEPEIATARVEVEQRYRSLTLPVVCVAGLIDGINPCAFATIIFFLSYLQISRRGTRDMIKVGIAFITAVFLAYFSAGLFLHKVLEQMTGRIAGIKPYLDWGFAGLALIAALLSFNDAIKARRGQTGEMTLTLPSFLKERIRKVIRSSSKASHFVSAAFVSGIVISFLELACTGQVYAPIIYSIQQGQMDAVLWLLVYNLAFILPLVVIFALTITGMSNQKLIQFQLHHTFLVKVALGLLFIGLAVVILYGAHWF